MGRWGYTNKYMQQWVQCNNYIVLMPRLGVVWCDLGDHLCLYVAVVYVLFQYFEGGH